MDQNPTRRDEREIESDLEDMMNSVSSAAYEGDNDIEDLKLLKPPSRLLSDSGQKNRKEIHSEEIPEGMILMDVQQKVAALIRRYKTDDPFGSLHIKIFVLYMRT